MAFNQTKQRSLRNTNGEYGTINFVADDSFVDVPTRLTTVFGGIGICAQSKEIASSDLTVTNGNVRFLRDNTDTISDELSYIIMGF